MIVWPRDKNDFHNKVASLLSLIVYGLSCTFVFSNHISNWTILAGSVLWFSLTIYDKKYLSFRFRNIAVILLVIYFLLQAISVTYSENMKLAMANFETKLPFIFFPLVFFAGHDVLEKINLKRILFIFSQGICVVCFLMLSWIIISTDNLGEAWYQYTFENLSGLLSLHPGYLSLFICFSILILLSHFYSYSRGMKVLVVCELLMLVLFAFRLASRMPIVGLGVCLLLYIIFEKKYKLLLIGLVTAIVLSFLITENSPDIKERYIRPMKLVLTGDVDSLKAYAFNRVQIYSCAVEVLSGPNLLTGVGNGDSNESLIKCYDKHDYWWVSRQKYNAHNEYLQSTLDVGILGGLILVFLVVYPFRFWSSMMEFPLFSTLFGVFSLTESTLQVQRGVIFFCFFYALFLAFAQKRNVAAE